MKGKDDTYDEEKRAKNAAQKINCLEVFKYIKDVINLIDMNGDVKEDKVKELKGEIRKFGDSEMKKYELDEKQCQSAINHLARNLKIMFAKLDEKEFLHRKWVSVSNIMEGFSDENFRNKFLTVMASKEHGQHLVDINYLITDTITKNLEALKDKEKSPDGFKDKYKEMLEQSNRSAKTPEKEDTESNNSTLGGSTP